VLQITVEGDQPSPVALRASALQDKVALMNGTATLPDFVRHDSVVRRIWGNGDMVLLVFAGSAAEFALNRAVDWLFFTGKLPGDPIGRLFATAGYAQKIVFADVATATAALTRRSSARGDNRSRTGPIATCSTC
jgi:hypothetical protein